VSVIKLVAFGGLVPKASARAIPGDGAQTATNLRPDSMEFRPALIDSTVVANSGVTNPKTIYRLARTAAGAFNTDMTTGWVVKAAELSFAKSQLNTDTAELTYATVDDGTTPPWTTQAPWVFAATDLTTGRQLGVPAATAAPTLVVNTVDEFTSEEREAGVSETLTYIYNEAKDKTNGIWLGAAAPTLDGYADRDGVIGGDAEEAQQVRVFCTDSVGGANNGTITDVYTAATPADFNWVKDPALGGYWQTQGGGWPAWSTASKDHWCVPFHAYGLTYDVGPAGGPRSFTTLNAVLAAIATPGEPGTPLLTAGQVTEIQTAITAHLDWKLAEAAPKINALKAKVEELHTILDTGTAAATAQAGAYWATAPVTAAIANAVATAAANIWAAAYGADVYVEFTV
jgi:hypothetical protein